MKQWMYKIIGLFDRTHLVTVVIVAVFSTALYLYLYHHNTAGLRAYNKVQETRMKEQDDTIKAQNKIIVKSDKKAAAWQQSSVRWMGRSFVFERRSDSLVTVITSIQKQRNVTTIQNKKVHMGIDTMHRAQILDYFGAGTIPGGKAGN